MDWNVYDGRPPLQLSSAASQSINCCSMRLSSLSNSAESTPSTFATVGRLITVLSPHQLPQVPLNESRRATTCLHLPRAFIGMVAWTLASATASSGFMALHGSSLLKIPWMRRCTLGVRNMRQHDHQSFQHDGSCACPSYCFAITFRQCLWNSCVSP